VSFWEKGLFGHVGGKQVKALENREQKRCTALSKEKKGGWRDSHEIGKKRAACIGPLGGGRRRKKGNCTLIE